MYEIIDYDRDKTDFFFPNDFTYFTPWHNFY